MRHLFCALFVVFLIACSNSPSSKSYSVRTIDIDNENILINGPFEIAQDSVAISDRATTIVVRFSGERVRAHMKDESGLNHFDVALDGKVVNRIKVDTVKRFYTLVSNLPEGKHTLELVKETDNGKTWFYGLELHNAELLRIPKHYKRVKNTAEIN